MNRRSLWPPWHLTTATLFSLSLLFALLYNGSHYHWLTLAWTLLLGFGLLCWLRPDTVPPAHYTTPLLLAIALLTVWVVVSQLWSPLPRVTAVTGWRLATLGFTFLIVTGCGGEARWRGLRLGVLVIGSGLALATLWQGLFTDLSASAAFTNRNINAGFLNLILWPAAALLLASRPAERRWPWLAALVYLAALALLQTSSRGAIGSGLLALLLLLALGGRGVSGRARLTLLTLLALALVSDALLPGAWGMERLATLADPVSASANRLLIWSATLEMIGAAPWYGIGAGLFAALYPAYRAATEGSAGFFVHNDYLQLWLELGWPALLLLVAVAVGLLLTLRRLYRLPPSNDRLEGFGLFAGVVAVLLHSLVTYNLYIVPTLLVVGLYLARLHRLAYPAVVATPPPPRRRATVIVVLLLMLLPLQYLASSGYAYALALGFLDREPFSDPAQRVAQLTTAMRLDPSADTYPLLLANLYRDLIPTNEVAAQRLLFDEAERLYALARTLNPYRPDGYWHYGQLLFSQPELAGSTSTERAETWADRALRLNPRVFQARLLKARLLEQRGQGEEGLALLVAGLAQPHPLDPGLRHYFGYAEALAQRLGRSDEEALFRLNKERVAQVLAAQR